MLVFEDFTIIKNDTQLFEPLSLTISSGSIVCISGANGVGKTSLLKSMAGLISFRGGISYNDWLLSRSNEYYSSIAYIGHRNSLDNELTVIQNLKFWANLSDMEYALEASLKTLNLSDIKNEKISTLSEGWAKRVELAKLLLRQSSLWLLDEPFVNLDVIGISTLKEMIRSRCSNHGMVIFTAQHKSTDTNVLNLNLESMC